MSNPETQFGLISNLNHQHVSFLFWIKWEVLMEMSYLGARGKQLFLFWCHLESSDMGWFRRTYLCVFLIRNVSRGPPWPLLLIKMPIENLVTHGCWFLEMESSRCYKNILWCSQQFGKKKKKTLQSCHLPQYYVLKNKDIACVWQLLLFHVIALCSLAGDGCRAQIWLSREYTQSARACWTTSKRQEVKEILIEWCYRLVTSQTSMGHGPGMIYGVINFLKKEFLGFP